MSESRRPRDRSRSYAPDGSRMYRCAARLSPSSRCRRYTSKTFGGVQVCEDHAWSMFEELAADLGVGVSGAA